jgi:hypothetical protein
VDFAERFMSHTRPEGDCLVWTGTRHRQGYGLTKQDGRTRRAHRVAWELEHGQAVPPGLLVCHSCDNPPCVRAAHLFLGTMRDNRRDAMTKGRTATGARHGSRTRPDRVPRGQRNGLAKIKDVELPTIRDRIAAGESNAAIAKDYGVVPGAIWNIRTGATHRPIP